MKGAVMLNGKVSFVAATRDFFSDRKVEIDEFKSLTHQDKVELREGLIQQGYDVDELKAPAGQ